jgi:hypothetical protein
VFGRMARVLSRPRLRAWRTRAILERDLRAFRRRYGAVLSHVPTRTDAGKVLLASLTYSPFQLKLEGMLAKAFQLQGVRPVAAVPADSDLPRRYLEVFGIERFVSVTDFLDAEADATAQREAERIVDGIDDAAALKAATYRGVSVGRQALSTVSRHLHDGAIDASDAQTRALLHDFVALAIEMTIASERLLDEVQPESVLFNERNYAAEGPLSDLALARELNVIQFVSGFEDDSLVFKRYTAATKGLHPRSVSDESWPQVEAMAWTPAHDEELEREFEHRYDGTTFLARFNQRGTRAATRDELAARLELDPERKTAVVFSHVLWDANMFYGRDLFADQEEWFVETVRAACENDRVDWIVKLHPANVWKLRRDGYEGELDETRAIRLQIGELPRHVRVLLPDSDVSTWSLFAVTDYGVTIRGSIGFELPCFGVPVLTAGTGFYSGRGFTIDSATAEEYLARLRSVETIPPLTREETVRARKHAYALFRRRQTRFTSFRSVYLPVDEIADSPFEATIDVSLSSPEKLERAEDLRRFGEWAVHSRALDYLEV